MQLPQPSLQEPQSPARSAPLPANPQPLECPTGQVAIEFTSIASVLDQESYTETVTIDGTVANATSQPVYVTPLRVYPLGAIQVDLSTWALYGTQTAPAPTVIGPGQSVAFGVRERVAGTLYGNISAWTFNTGYTQLAFTAAPYATSCSALANAVWGSPIENH